MRSLYHRLHAAWTGTDRGATAVEYALIVAAIALVVVVGAIALGQVVDNPFGTSASCAGDLTTCPN